MLTSLIVDDKSANINTLKELLKMYCPRVSVIGIANNIDDAYIEINRLQPNLIFLDIQMPNGTGFDLLKKFKETPFEVIFTTAYNQYAIQAFRENALDYLLKPIDIDALQEAVNKAEKHIGLKQSSQNLAQHLEKLQAPMSSKISLPTQDGFLFINYQDVIRCEAAGSYTTFYMGDGNKIMVSMHLKECEDILPVKYFIRVHNSHIVNIQFVTKYFRGRGGYIVMQDNSTVTIASSRKDAFLLAMQQQL